MSTLPSSVGATYTISTPVEAVVADKINSGRQQIVITGSIKYNDGFPDTPEQTWQFCNMGLFREKLKKLEWTLCDPTLYIKELIAIDHYPKDEYPGTPYTPKQK